MNEKTAKIVSTLILNWRSEAELEYYLSFIEKTGKEFFDSLSKEGLLSWRINRVFNKINAIKTSEVYIYRDQKSFIRGQVIIGKFRKRNESFYKRITFQVDANRALVLFEFLK